MGKISVLVLEYVTGGGMIGRDLPESWRAEGGAMRRAIARDFAALPDVRVSVAIDPRLVGERHEGAETVAVEGGSIEALAGFASGFDYTALIAPETGGVLEDLTRAILEAGGRPLGSEPDAVAVTADKAWLARHFQENGIPTPPTHVLADGTVPDDWPEELVVKPIDGAGSVDTFYIRDRGKLPRDPRMIAQPSLEGRQASATFLVDRVGRAWPIGVGLQDISTGFSEGHGRITYLGGRIGRLKALDLSPITRAVDSVPGLRGLVGVDFFDSTPRGMTILPDAVTILEINPRPTTSLVGLTALLPPGTLASAWLVASERGLEGTDWPDKIRVDRSAPRRSVLFRADGKTWSG